jgi:hypothetical protein
VDTMLRPVTPREALGVLPQLLKVSPSAIHTLQNARSCEG